jgi:3'-5' exoribonuclease 1
LNFIIYDIEATCDRVVPKDYFHEIIEIGAVRYDDHGFETGRFSTLVRPIINPSLTSFCSELTGISQTDVNKADLFPRVMEDFYQWCSHLQEGDDFVLCSWGSFDKRVMLSNSKAHEYESEWINQHINLKLQYQMLVKSKIPIGLNKGLIREGLEFQGTPHRALDDAINTGRIFIKRMTEWKLKY